jgi:carbon-monoxide dehydrogenase medium subunit
VEVGRLVRPAVALFGVGGVPSRLAEVERLLIGSELDGAAAAAGLAAAAAVDPPSDSSGSAWYRRRLVASMVERAVARAIERARRAV